MPHFTDGEMEVMQVLWEHGELKPTDIQDRFPRQISNMALRGALRVLMDKGHVERRKFGRAYVYKAITPQRTAMRTMTRKMADVFAGGSTFALIAQLVQSEKLSEKHIRDLQRMASESSEQKTPRKKGRG
jgi:BlaI family transcriptional regulator, penicillinase repressor